MSFKPEVQADSTGKWCGHTMMDGSVRAPIPGAEHIMGATVEVEPAVPVFESDDPVNYQFVDGKLIEIATSKAVKPVDDRLLD